jgi:hypothetical protein
MADCDGRRWDDVPALPRAFAGVALDGRDGIELTAQRLDQSSTRAREIRRLGRNALEHGRGLRCGPDLAAVHDAVTRI